MLTLNMAFCLATSPSSEPLLSQGLVLSIPISLLPRIGPGTQGRGAPSASDGWMTGLSALLEPADRLTAPRLTLEESD